MWSVSLCEVCGVVLCGVWVCVECESVWSVGLCGV